MLTKLASLPGRLPILRHKKIRRYLAFAFLTNVVGYSLVIILTSQAGMGTWWANTTVSKGMAPVGLALNTLALTGTLLPTRAQTVKWFLHWFPSAIVSAIFLAFVIANFGLESIQARAAVGMMLFPFDFAVKRFVVFSKQARLASFFLARQAWLASFLLRQRFVLVVTGVLICQRCGFPKSHIKLQTTEAV